MSRFYIDVKARVVSLHRGMIRFIYINGCFWFASHPGVGKQRISSEEEFLQLFKFLNNCWYIRSSFILATNCNLLIKGIEDNTENLIYFYEKTVLTSFSDLIKNCNFLLKGSDFPTTVDLFEDLLF